MMKKKCELCNSAAKLFCESDQATLCWECDAKVHSANFLVTKHRRILLCHVCQSLTAWHGSGPKFVPTISVCADCITKNDHHHDNHHDGDDTTRDDDDDDDVDGEEEEEDDEENQVVPWTSTSSSTLMPPPPVSSSSNSAATTTTSTSN